MCSALWAGPSLQQLKAAALATDCEGSERAVDLWGCCASPQLPLHKADLCKPNCACTFCTPRTSLKPRSEQLPASPFFPVPRQPAPCTLRVLGGFSSAREVAPSDTSGHATMSVADKERRDKGSISAQTGPFRVGEEELRLLPFLFSGICLPAFDYTFISFRLRS